MARAGFRGFRRRHRASGIRHGRLGARRRRRGAPAFVRPMLPSRVDARSRPHRRGARNRPSLRNRAALPLGGTRAHGVRHPRRVLHREHRGHDECRAGGRHPPSSHIAVQRAHDGRGSGHGHFGTAPHIPVLPLPLDMPHPGHRICGRHPVRTGRRPCCRGRIAWRPFHLLPDRPDLLRQLRCRRPRDPRPGLKLGMAVRACGRPSRRRFVDRSRTADVGAADGAHRGERGVHRRSRDGHYGRYGRDLHIPAHPRDRKGSAPRAWEGHRDRIAGCPRCHGPAR